MEQTYEDLTQTLKRENEKSKMDIEGTVIKIELKPPLAQIKKVDGRPENSNQDKHFVEKKSENQAHDQNEQRQNILLIEETIDVKLENEEIRSYICGKKLNSEDNIAKEKKQNVCKNLQKMFFKKAEFEIAFQNCP